MGCGCQGRENQLVSHHFQKTGEKEAPEGRRQCSKIPSEGKRAILGRGRVYVGAVPARGLLPSHTMLPSRARGNEESWVKYCSQRDWDCLLPISTNSTAFRRTGMWLLSRSTCQGVGCGSHGKLMGCGLAQTIEVESQEVNIRGGQHEAISWGPPEPRRA